MNISDTILLPEGLEPLPCPFCGEEQKPETTELYYRGYGPPPSYQMTCGYCGANGPASHGRERDDHYNAKIDAVSKWNGYATLAKAKATLEQQIDFPADLLEQARLCVIWENIRDKSVSHLTDEERAAWKDMPEKDGRIEFDVVAFAHALLAMKGS